MPRTRTSPPKIPPECLGAFAGGFAIVRLHALGGLPAWQPRINLYRCRGRFVVCAELAGVDRSEIDLRVEPTRVVLTGARRPPAPAADHGPLLQIMAWEIDDGPWEREIPLPEPVVPDAARAEQRNGLLWIELPVASV